MKKLLVHSNNTSFSNTELFSLTEQFIFDVDFDKDVDFYINEILTNGELKPKVEKSDIVFIKVSLSNNYLEYLGLRLAYHVRLTKSLNDKAFIPIVFIAEEDIPFLGLTSKDPHILFTKGIHLIRENLEDYLNILERQNQGKIRPAGDIEEFVDSIVIHPPANYQSHHSTANEWALIRYCSLFRKDVGNQYYDSMNEAIRKLHYTKTLHFKYINAKGTRQYAKSKPEYNPVIQDISDLKIGIIDDEISKGWIFFYQYVFSKSGANVVPYCDFRKEESREVLISKLEHWILGLLETSAIDLFIIDLRLHPDDFEERTFDELSGIKIIKFIKSKNPGIQIVIFTASNKVWNYQNCLKYGVKFYSLKESPELFYNRQETKDTLDHFCNQLGLASKHVYLHRLYSSISELKSNILFIKENEEFHSSVFGKNGILDQIFSLLLLRDESSSVMNQCLILSFSLLDMYCSLPTISNFGKKSISKISSGSIFKRDETIFHVLINKGGLCQARFKLTSGRFSFQVSNTNESPVDFTEYEDLTSWSTSGGNIGPDVSSLVKMIAVLRFRDDVKKEDVKRLIELRYLRSNVAAHLTGNVIPSHVVTSSDIEFFVGLFRKIFVSNTPTTVS